MFLKRPQISDIIYTCGDPVARYYSKSEQHYLSGNEILKNSPK